VNEAITLLEAWKDNEQPFFLNLWFDVPHTPYEPAPEPHLSKYAKMGATGDQLYFRSMVSNLDENIGRLIRKLKELGLYENTLVLFTSDNGAAWEGEVGPFKGGKTDLHEGGIRVPFLAVWPGKIPENRVSFQCGQHIDLLPTICEAANVDYEEHIDGMSLLPNLCKGEEIDRGLILWQLDLYKRLQRHYEKPEPYATNVAYKGPWKLLLDSLTPVALYHLENDAHEVMNLLGKYPEIEKELTDETELFMSEPRNPWN
jgi:arylsulfatase A-like enzyme